MTKILLGKENHPLIIINIILIKIVINKFLTKKNMQKYVDIVIV